MAGVSGKYPFVWPLLWVCVRLSETSYTGVSLDDDVLRPYAGAHGPGHSHRHVRDCQPAAHGNLTHEILRPPAAGVGLPAAESTVFVSDVPRSSRLVYGHVTVVRDPLRTLSVLEPGGPGGCEANRRATVEQTAAGAGCLYAQNAGFFDTDSHRCLGNVVSDGRPVRDSGGVQNAQFGIRRDGSLVFGRTWLTITSTLASLLLASLLLHLVRGCGGAVAAAAARRPGRRGDYSYVPLVSLNGATQDDPDSQEEIWSPGTSSGKSSPRRGGQIFADQRCGRPDLQQEEQNSGASGSAELVNHQEPWKDFLPHAPSNEKHLVGL